MLTRDVMRSTTRGFERYYNPVVGNAVNILFQAVTAAL